MTEGGDGCILYGEMNPQHGKIRSEEERHRISELTKDAMKNEQIRHKISEGLKGNDCLKKGKLNNPNLQKLMSDRSWHSRILKSRSNNSIDLSKTYIDLNDPLYMCDEYGKVIATFKSTREAATFISNNSGNIRSSIGHINDCCRGVRKSVHGYVWKKRI